MPDFDDDPKEQYEPSHDLSVLHRWELLHMIWEPIGLGASGRVLSVLFRVLPPGRTLRMSLAAVAREAAVTKQTVVRVYKALRATGILVTATDGKPAIDYVKALDAAIRSVASRPAGERERRLVRLQEIATALGKTIRMEFIDAKLAEFSRDPSIRLPGRQTRKQNRRRAHVVTDRAHVAPDWAHVVTDRAHVAPAPGTRCATELNLNGSLNLKSNWKHNGPPEGGASRLPGEHPDGHPDRPLGPIQASYGGQPTLIARALDLMLTGPGTAWSRSEVAAMLDATPVHMGYALRELCQRGYAERIGYGLYRLTQAARAAWYRGQAPGAPRT